MKQFSCGDVVPGCDRHFTGTSEQEILASVAVHAQRDHGLVEIPAGLVDQVRAQIFTR